jgi:hypothetical protein
MISVTGKRYRLAITNDDCGHTRQIQATWVAPLDRTGPRRQLFEAASFEVFAIQAWLPEWAATRRPSNRPIRSSTFWRSDITRARRCWSLAAHKIRRPQT